MLTRTEAGAAILAALIALTVAAFAVVAAAFVTPMAAGGQAPTANCSEWTDGCVVCARTAEGERRANELREQYAKNGRQLGVSVDRADYTKGIPERLRALDLLWTQHEELRDCVTMIVVATPSRSVIASY